jgi:FkbM family methyltransferase
MNLKNLSQYNFNSVLDIGAHHGNFYRELSKIKHIEKWLLIEANKNCEGHLASLNIPFKIAMLSDEVKNQPYYQHKFDNTCTGNSYYRELSHHYKDENIVVDIITTCTLDDIVNNEQYDFIKIDTQGAEIDILRGGLRTLKRAKLVLLETSVIPYNENAPLQREVVEFMYSYGFNNYIVIDQLMLPNIHQEDLLFTRNE